MKTVNLLRLRQYSNLNLTTTTYVEPSQLGTRGSGADLLLVGTVAVRSRWRDGGGPLGTDLPAA